MLKGRDLIEPTNFTVEELDEIFALANDILNDEKNMWMYVMGNYWQAFFMNLQQERNFLSTLRCTGLAVMS